MEAKIWSSNMWTLFIRLSLSIIFLWCSYHITIHLWSSHPLIILWYANTCILINLAFYFYNKVLPLWYILKYLFILIKVMNYTTELYNQERGQKLSRKGTSLTLILLALEGQSKVTKLSFAKLKMGNFN